MLCPILLLKVTSFLFRVFFIHKKKTPRERNCRQLFFTSKETNYYSQKIIAFHCRWLFIYLFVNQFHKYVQFHNNIQYAAFYLRSIYETSITYTRPRRYYPWLKLQYILLFKTLFNRKIEEQKKKKHHLKWCIQQRQLHASIKILDTKMLSTVDICWTGIAVYIQVHTIHMRVRKNKIK